MFIRAKRSSLLRQWLNYAAKFFNRIGLKSRRKMILVLRSCPLQRINWRRDIQPDVTQPKGTQPNDTQPNDTQHLNTPLNVSQLNIASKMTLSLTSLKLKALSLTSPAL
jgi:hypothetical protein